MKKTFGPVLWIFTLLLAGCIEITQEITLNKDGGGIWESTTDMSAVMGFLKTQMNKDSSAPEKMAVDTLVHFKDVIDSVKDLTAEQKRLLEKGSMQINLNSETEKFLFSTKLPFSKSEDLDQLMGLMQKEGFNAIDKVMSKSLGEEGEGKEKNPDENLFNNLPESYFDLVIKPGKITRTLNKAKYDSIGENKTLNQIKEMGGMGAPFKTKIILNLPKPAKKATGSGVMLSPDKKKVIVENEMTDLFDDPSKYEFTIEY